MSTQFWVAVAGWVIIGILCVLFQRSLTKMRSKPPEYITNLISELPDGWRLVSYKWMDHLDFEADLSFGERVFRISSDQGRIRPDEVVDGKPCGLPPHRIIRDTLIPKTLAEQLIEASMN
jgi:hypothetical protein